MTKAMFWTIAQFLVLFGFAITELSIKSINPTKLYLSFKTAADMHMMVRLDEKLIFWSLALYRYQKTLTSGNYCSC